MKYRENEKGVALLLALGFAALLLVLIMGFSTNALIDRKVAANNGDKTQARGLAMSAVNRAIVAMQFQMFKQALSSGASYDQGLYRFDNIVSKKDTSDTAISDSDLDSIFYKLAADRYLLKYRDNVYIYEYPKKADIDYSYNNDGSSLNNKLRRPQWQDVKNEDNTKIIGRFWYAVLPDLGRVYKKADGSGNGDKKGYSISEFDIKQFSSNMNDSDIDFEHTAQWSAEIAADSSLAFKDRAFWVFNAVEPRKSSATENNRNTRYRNSSDNFEKNMVNILAGNLKASELVTKVDYLNGKEQLAANIIGMFDSDIALEDISDKIDWEEGEDAPAYTGNLLTPYLNEIEVKLEFVGGLAADDKGDTNGDGTNEFAITPKINAVITVELYDPFGRTYGNNAAIVPKNFKGTVEFLKNSAVASEKEIKLEDASWTNGGSGKYITAIATIPVTGDEISDEAGFKVSARLKNFKGDWIYKRSYPAANSAVKPVDYARIEKAAELAAGASEELTVSSESPTSSSGSATVFSAQAKDALNNLNSSDWSYSTTSTVGAANSGVTENSVFADLDKLSKYVKGEVDAKPTLADLQYVSRGENNETLKILSDDKELLDQLTTMQDTDPQLIDINTRSARIWKGLLADIKNDNNAVVLSDSDIDDVVKEFSKGIRVDKKFFKRRSDAVEFLASKLDSSVDSPLLIGKMISLCKTEDYPEYVNLIVVAQTVKDNEGLGTLGTFDKDDDIITSEVRYLVKLRRTEDYKMEIISVEELID